MDRATWLSERRRTMEERADTIHAPTYDEVGGVYDDTTQHRMVARLLGLCPLGAAVLDAACGTGKYWPLILDGRRTLVGADQSAGMLARAQAKFPQVETRKVGLQEMEWEAAFDAITCVDAMEFVFPEDWPRVLVNFHRTLRPRGLLYVSVEQAEPDLPAVYAAAIAASLPVVEGEYVKGDGYHYYPAIEQVHAWLAAARFAILDEAEGPWYRHIIARRQ